ncbi:hypothetical protein ADUPG1_009563, partial [Aduncisulcus paluster]
IDMNPVLARPVSNVTLDARVLLAKDTSKSAPPLFTDALPASLVEAARQKFL